MVRSLTERAKNFPGSANLYFQIIDTKDSIVLRPSKLKISPKEFLVGVRSYNDIKVKIN